MYSPDAEKIKNKTITFRFGSSTKFDNYGFSKESTKYLDSLIYTDLQGQYITTT
jgi:hypothetical protein